jgi:hypothetical protein
MPIELKGNMGSGVDILRIFAGNRLAIGVGPTGKSSKT